MPVSVHQTIGLHEETRRKALELFAERGFASVGIRELAAHLGIAAGSIYYHIENKQALLCELIEDLYETLLMEPQIKPRSGESATLRLQRLLKRHLKLHASKSLYFLIAEREIHYLEPQHRQTIAQLRTRYEQQLLTLLAEVAHIEISHELRSFASSCVSLLNNMPLWLTQGQPGPAKPQALLFDMVQSFISVAIRNIK